MNTPVVHILIDEYQVPRTINQRVKVKMIIQKHLAGGEPVQAIAEHYGIELADVHAALTYYYDNQAQMDAEFEREEALLQEVGVSGAALRESIQRRTRHDNQP